MYKVVDADGLDCGTVPFEQIKEWAYTGVIGPYTVLVDMETGRRRDAGSYEELARVFWPPVPPAEGSALTNAILSAERHKIVAYKGFVALNDDLRAFFLYHGGPDSQGAHLLARAQALRTDFPGDNPQIVKALDGIIDALIQLRAAADAFAKMEAAKKK